MGGARAAGRQQESVRWVYLKDYIALRRNRAGLPEATLSHQDWLDLITRGNEIDSEIVDAVLSSDDPEPFAKLIEGLFEQKQYYCAC